ncbi:phosphatase PAP2 family protein [Pseudoduganella violaceinigra]|uniref:phosphatase PAP2 family protein n=1 Tax=Pseudoduganella violaceinigra TaxID=246602 RepID=UPI0003FA5DAF|nr:phosphatase PAP2 family protein [Pseudoduganella violaceinigra]
MSANALNRLACGAVLACAFALPAAHADGGPLGIDHRLNVDNDGIWGRSQQHIMMGALFVGTVGLGLWEGGDTRLGRTDWQAIDAMLLTAVSTEVMKRTFRRKRPNSTDDPGQWFGSSRDRSFPSGEAAAFSAAVTPFILEYGQERPWVYALAALPVYDGIARMKTRGHWQTDVLAGIALGSAFGYYAHQRGSSFTLSVLPHGIQVGYRTRW